eukprot:354423-Chlamydomonas_euryale.AAC.11
MPITAPVGFWPLGIVKRTRGSVVPDAKAVDTARERAASSAAGTMPWESICACGGRGGAGVELVWAESRTRLRHEELV